MKRTSLLIIALAAYAVALPQAPPPPPPPGDADVPEECRPKHPEPGKKRTNCCEMPRPISPDNEKLKNAFTECREKVMAEHPDAMPPHHPPHPPHSGGSPPPPPPAGASPPPPPPPHRHRGPPSPQHKLFFTCMDECFFNKSGLMTAEMKLNADSISKLVGEVLETDSTWKPVAEEAVKTCVEKANEVKDEGECKPGPHAFTKCFMREMYLKCPSGVWQETDECKAEKEQMEKCPNLMPRPPFPPHMNKEHKGNKENKENIEKKDKKE